MARSHKKFCCPKCGKEVTAIVQSTVVRNIIFKCPGCYSNVYIFNNKIGLLSDRFVAKLVRQKKVDYCGFVFDCERKIKRTKAISKDDVLNLKILLETENNVDKIISSL